jgi:hypothetical protein
MTEVQFPISRLGNSVQHRLQKKSHASILRRRRAGGFSQGAKDIEDEADHFYPSNSETKNGWSLTFHLYYAFRA